MDPTTCFRSKTCSSAKTTKFFSLLPNFSLQRKFVSFNAIQWRHLFNACGIRLRHDPNAREGIDKQAEDFLTFDQSLDFKKVGLRFSRYYLCLYDREYPWENAAYVFDNLIRTDGHTIEFVFGARKSEFGGLPDLRMPDLANEDIDRFHVYGVDPGHNHLFTAADQQHTKLRFSNNEWYTKAGFKRRRYAEQQRKKQENITNIESQIPSRKTNDPDNFANCCQYYFDHLPELTTFYGSTTTNNQFMSYVGQQRMASEVVNIFASGGEKYEHAHREE